MMIVQDLVAKLRGCSNCEAKFVQRKCMRGVYKHGWMSCMIQYRL